MTAVREAATTWELLVEAQQRHHAAFGDAVNDYRHGFGIVLDEEIDRAADMLAGEAPLRAVLAPLASHLRDYLRWLRWSAWLGTQLPPPLELLSRRDRLRHAVAVLTYLGARLVDDGIDGHLHYKNKRNTLVADLLALFPHCDEAAARCHSALAGFWILNYGQRRMRQIGETRVADMIARLFASIPRGVFAESADGTNDLTVYDAIVQHKSVAYDMLLHQALLAPVEEGPRTILLRALATTSSVAQYLNDVADRNDDAGRGQPNVVLRWFDRADDVTRCCLERIDGALHRMDALDPAQRDAVAAIMAEVFLSARTLWGTEEREPEERD
jgi:hypothetical protein